MKQTSICLEISFFSKATVWSLSTLGSKYQGRRVQRREYFQSQRCPVFKCEFGVKAALCLVDPLLLAAKPLLQGGLKSRAEIRSVAFYQTPLQGRVNNSVSFHTAFGYLSELW